MVIYVKEWRLLHLSDGLDKETFKIQRPAANTHWMPGHYCLGANTPLLLFLADYSRCCCVSVGLSEMEILSNKLNSLVNVNSHSTEGEVRPPRPVATRQAPQRSRRTGKIMRGNNKSASITIPRPWRARPRLVPALQADLETYHRIWIYA